MYLQTNARRSVEQARVYSSRVSFHRGPILLTMCRLTCEFPLLDFAVQEADAQARGARKGQRGQDGVDPHVVDDDLVVHVQPAVHVHRAMGAVARGAASDHGYHGRGGRGHRTGRDRGCGPGRGRGRGR